MKQTLEVSAIEPIALSKLGNKYHNLVFDLGEPVVLQQTAFGPVVSDKSPRVSVYEGSAWWSVVCAAYAAWCKPGQSDEEVHLAGNPKLPIENCEREGNVVAIPGEDLDRKLESIHASNESRNAQRAQAFIDPATMFTQLMAGINAGKKF